MNKDNAKDFLPLVQALADGKTIQRYYRTGWADVTDVNFIADVAKYRVKPEPRVIYVNIYSDGSGAGHSTEERAKLCAGNNTHAIEVAKKFVEVME